MSLKTKGIFVVAIPVLGLLLAIGVFYAFEQQARDAEFRVHHTYQARSEIRRVLIRLSNVEAGVRGYLVTGEDSFLDPYYTARRELPDPLQNLQVLMADNPQQLERLATARRLTTEVLETAEGLRRKGNAGLAELQAAGAKTGELRQVLSGMEAEEERLLAERETAEQRARDRLKQATLLGGILGTLGGMVAALIFTSGIVRRVHRLQRNAQRVAQGLPIAEEIKGHDEIAQLETTLQQTSILLNRQSEELQRVQAELETRVQQRTSELKTANDQLRRAMDISNAVIESSPLAIWSIDLAGMVTYCNPAAERMYGWTQAELAGKPVPIIPADQTTEFQTWLERFRRGDIIAGVERTRLRKDGTPLDVEIWSAPLRDSAGQISGTIVIQNDVTGRKTLEEQFRQSQKLEAVGRLAGGIAHDFNNLLTVITGYSEMVINEAGELPNILNFTQEIHYAANRAGALTAQLLAFSRRQISQPKIIDLNEMVSQSMKLLRRIIGEDIEIALQLDPSLARIKADPIHIDQVVMNLVVNARDAMFNGGRITIESANTVLDAEYSGKHIGVPAGRYAMLAISDTGTGMDAATKSRIFEPFFTTKEAGRGTGLGLSIVYGIVKQNGGEIMVYSEPGKGTTFKVYFPFAEVPVESGVGAGPQPELPGTETVLLCEDEEGIRKLVRAMLARFGYQILETETPEQALDVVRARGEEIDLLLTDIVMPHISGFDLAKSVRAIRPEIRVLYMSGYTDTQVSSMNSGWVLDADTPFIQKPFTVSALTQKVREALGSQGRSVPLKEPRP